MTDLETLHEAWEAPAAPSDRARAEARAALLNRARPRARRRRLAVAGAVTVAVVVGLAVLDEPSGNGPKVPIASAAVLERAAAAAERRQFTPPRDDQWIYIEDRMTRSDGGAPETRRLWRRADGGGLAWRERGRLRVETLERVRKLPGGRAIPLVDGYKALAALPTDPDALLRWAYERAEHISGAGLSEHGDVYAIFNGMVRENVLPPDLQAAIFRALARVPGVKVETVDVSGRQALALGQTEDWLHEELLLDPTTYEYRGERSTIVRDATIDPLKAGNATGRVERGSRVISERVATAIVGEPGELP